MIVSKTRLVLATAALSLTLMIGACSSDGGTDAEPTASLPTSASVADPATSEPTGDPATADPITAEPVTDEPTITAVDPESFRPGAGTGTAGGGVYFRSPSGNVNCGILDPDVDFAGCQAISSVPSSEGTVCKNAGNSLYMDTINADGAVSTCTSQGVFFTDPPSKVLEYGQSISTRGVTCLSTTSGIECSRGSSRFVMSRERNDVRVAG